MIPNSDLAKYTATMTAYKNRIAELEETLDHSLFKQREEQQKRFAMNKELQKALMELEKCKKEIMELKQTSKLDTS